MTDKHQSQIDALKLEVKRLKKLGQPAYVRLMGDGPPELIKHPPMLSWVPTAGPTGDAQRAKWRELGCGPWLRGVLDELALPEDEPKK